MKKILSIILLISIIASTFGFTTFAATEEIIVLTSQNGSVKNTVDCRLTGTWSMSSATNNVWGPGGDTYVWYTTKRMPQPHLMLLS